MTDVVTIQNDLDPITVEVIRTHFQSTARQMRNTLIRASFNPMIYEMVDFSLGIYNKEAELIAEGPGIPVFLGTLTFAIREIVKYVGAENLDEGDVILCTYPYWTGAHSQDAITLQPIFVDGAIVGYACVKAHWLDLGAKDIYGTDTTDIWQEGLQVFGAKVVKKGKLDREIVEIIRANSRMPDAVVGDLTAQVSACNLGARRTLEAISKYGRATVEGATARILDHGEQIARAAIASMPDGEWTGEGALDSDGITDELIPVHAKVTIRGDEMIVDTTGTAPQQAGPMNCPLASTISAVRLVMKMVVAPGYDANEGFFRSLKVIVPEGTVLNPLPPAPVFLYGWATNIVGSAVFQALAKGVPERAVARSGNDVGSVLFSGTHPGTGQYFAGGTDECVGQGAAFDEDGENALVNFTLGESRNMPNEILEERYPLLVESYELWPDSGGAGRFRGGLGVRKEWRALSDQSIISAIEQTKTPAWGVDGGREGLPNAMILDSRGAARRIGKISGYKFPQGQHCQLEMGGGGGWGDPLSRDPQAVLADVVGGYVSLDAARRDYGVVIEQLGLDVYRLDADATARAREIPASAQVLQ